MANTLHHNSHRCKRPFIKLNCVSLNENLLESDLFSHEAGAFTGATGRRKGRFELADKGSLFLDEIGDMSQQTQAKTLRVLQEVEFERLGGNETAKVEVRLLAAFQKYCQINVLKKPRDFQVSLFNPKSIEINK